MSRVLKHIRSGQTAYRQQCGRRQQWLGRLQAALARAPLLYEGARRLRKSALHLRHHLSG
jgi:hypothetical protein